MHGDIPYMYGIIQVCRNDKPDMYDFVSSRHARRSCSVEMR